ncbi:EKC/KEOPS complex subunit LAGE3 [Anopheles arabiensis]|uniref:L antigen family member 3 n=3 Tax=gambiae species complex TaxID=44542 RepID=A0A1S4H691_ANOGA|nr:EKC/KEOPS complex subunit LAGE3 [Anopheles arabiensis]XP_040234859.1 EKC/KEOPS complex subunit LAGE3 [Anopheles coluzzii]XP_309339.3 EKC/KEOPS complex subunit LAGE3 [Anopheles gambiae]
MCAAANIEVSIKIPFPTKREAEIAYDVLRVDSEPKRSFVHKTITLEENHLLLRLGGEQAKNVRVGVTSFCELLLLCCETLDQFGPPKSDRYEHY